MRKITDRKIWIGNANDLLQPEAIFEAGIEVIVELADCEQFAVLPRELIRCRFPLSDGGDNPEWLLKLAIRTLVEIFATNQEVLVCCSAGMSRSVCVTAAALSHVDQSPFPAAMSEVIREGAVDVSPGLLGQIQKCLDTLKIRRD